MHEIIFHGKGGYDWYTVYDMPIWLRNFTYRSIEEFYDKEREQQEKQSRKKTLTSNNTPQGPDIKPASYSTKARQ